jgi:hypothetical protein
MEAEKSKYVKIIKTCPGNLIIRIVNPMTRLEQRLEFMSGKNEQLISLEWASYVYSDSSSGVYKMFRDGYFTFDDPELVAKTAKENGILMGDVDFTPNSPSYVDDILVVLKKGDKTAIDGYLTSPKGADDVIQIANSHIGELTKSTISYLEEKCKISLEVDGGPMGSAE